MSALLILLNIMGNKTDINMQLSVFLTLFNSLLNPSVNSTVCYMNVVILKLPIRMSYENIPLACISLEDKSHILSQGIESVCGSYLWC